MKLLIVLLVTILSSVGFANETIKLNLSFGVYDCCTVPLVDGENHSIYLTESGSLLRGFYELNQIVDTTEMTARIDVTKFPADSGNYSNKYLIQVYVSVFDPVKGVNTFDSLGSMIVDSLDQVPRLFLKVNKILPIFENEKTMVVGVSKPN